LALAAATSPSATRARQHAPPVGTAFVLGAAPPLQKDTSLLILDYGWGENHSPLTATLSRSGSGAAVPTGLLPPLLGPPLRGPLTPV
jgi:hypothetical protein